LTVDPHDVAAGRRIRFRFLATTLGGSVRRPAPAATIRFAGRSTRTNGRGRATIVTSFDRPGRHRAIATKPGLIGGSAFVEVRAEVRAAGGARRINAKSGLALEPWRGTVVRARKRSPTKRWGTA
jgi:hypothetical protein